MFFLYIFFPLPVFHNGFVLSVQPAVTEAFHIPSWKLSRVGTHIILSRTMKSLPHIHSKIRIFTTTVSSVNRGRKFKTFLQSDLLPS
jgi:hypothetical protein